MINLLAWTGYWVGIGIEVFVIVIAAVLLALMLTGVLFKWIAAAKEKSAQRKAEREAEREAREAAAEAEATAEAEAEAEAAAAEEEEVEEEEVVEETEEEEPKPEKKPKKSSKVVEEAEAEDPEIVYIQGDGIVFNDSKSITELYEELTNEQKSFFDELREEALTKPDAELSISKNFITVKIGKRNLIKLLIKRGVTVAEFMLENEALKQFRISNKDKKGKARIKVKPTVVQVLDLPSLKVAIDMINLAYEELMMDEF